MSLKAKLEAVIYAAEEPVTLNQLAALFAAEALEWKAAQEAAAREQTAEVAGERAGTAEPMPLLAAGLEYLGLEDTPAVYAEPGGIRAHGPLSEPASGGGIGSGSGERAGTMAEASADAPAATGVGEQDGGRAEAEAGAGVDSGSEAAADAQEGSASHSIAGGIAHKAVGESPEMEAAEGTEEAGTELAAAIGSESEDEAGSQWGAAPGSEAVDQAEAVGRAKAVDRAEAAGESGVQAALEGGAAATEAEAAGQVGEAAEQSAAETATDQAGGEDAQEASEEASDEVSGRDSGEASDEASDEASGEGAETGAEASSEPPAEPAGVVDIEAETKRLSRLRDREVKSVLKQLLDELIASSEGDGRGVEIREIAGGYRMATKPEYHDAVRVFVKSLKPALKLSLPALETLAVVAYKQPVTAPEVSEIRGVESAGVLGSLLARKLIATAGRKQVIGRPILYKTTKEFLLRFGLRDVAELPSMEEFEKMAAVELEEPGEMGPQVVGGSGEAEAEARVEDTAEALLESNSPSGEELAGTAEADEGVAEPVAVAWTAGGAGDQDAAEEAAGEPAAELDTVAEAEMKGPEEQTAEPSGHEPAEAREEVSRDGKEDEEEH